MEKCAEQWAGKLRDANPSKTSALYFKYGDTSLGYAFAYPKGHKLSSFVPNPFNIHNVNTSVDISLSESATEFANMFSIEYQHATTSNEIIYTATYNGELDRAVFIEMWNNRIATSGVEAYAKEMALELQEKNPAYIVALTFKHGAEKVGYYN